MIDLNCDMGELDDAAHEEALMRRVTSANVACGAHAGSQEIMERTTRLALRYGVHIGAHPSYPDRANFGRVEMSLAPADLERTLLDQLHSLDAIVRACGGRITHVKPHGALYNVAARDQEIAAVIGRAVQSWDPSAEIFGLAGSRGLEVWRGMGLGTAAEGFADRRYEPDGSLRSRKFADAVIRDPGQAAAQALQLARAGTVDTICVHGDSADAVAVLAAVAEALTGAGLLRGRTLPK